LVFIAIKSQQFPIQQTFEDVGAAQNYRLSKIVHFSELDKTSITSEIQFQIYTIHCFSNETKPEYIPTLTN